MAELPMAFGPVNLGILPMVPSPVMVRMSRGSACVVVACGVPVACGWLLSPVALPVGWASSNEGLRASPASTRPAHTFDLVETWLKRFIVNLLWILRY